MVRPAAINPVRIAFVLVAIRKIGLFIARTPVLKTSPPQRRNPAANSFRVYEAARAWNYAGYGRPPGGAPTLGPYFADGKPLLQT